MKSFTPSVLILMSLLATPGTTLAWGSIGHKLVCGAAENHLTKKGRQFVKKISEYGEFLKGGVLSFPESCLWPDKVKYSTRMDSYEHHFLNIPSASERINLERDCASLSCLPVGIQKSITYLSNPPKGEREKGRQAAALRFLGHYIGDLHQPLHVSNASDWGGNRIKVRWYSKKSNLHRVWDVNIVEKSGLRYPGSVAFITDFKTDPGAINIKRWFEDSYTLTNDRAYLHPDGVRIKNGDHLGEVYFNANKGLVIEQIALAAHRLALTINAIAAGNPPVVFGLSW